MKLYEIDAEIEQCILIDEETGEVIGIDTERADKLQMMRDDKIKNLALYYKNLMAEVNAYKSEKDYFAKRERVAKNKAESIKKFLNEFLAGEKFESPKVNITYRKSESVVIDDINKVDKQYLKYTEPAVDKVEAKKAIKSGVLLEGLHIEENQNIQINEFNNCKNFVITFKEVDVSQNHTIRCIVKSHKSWHKYQFYDCEITLMFPVLPPL